MFSIKQVLERCCRTRFATHSSGQACGGSSDPLEAKGVCQEQEGCFSEATLSFPHMPIWSPLHFSWSWGVLGTGPVFQPVHVSSEKMHSFSHVNDPPLQARSFSALICLQVESKARGLALPMLVGRRAAEGLRMLFQLIDLMTVSPRWM